MIIVALYDLQVIFEFINWQLSDSSEPALPKKNAFKSRELLDGNNHVGERLRRLRKIAGVTQSELADRLRIGQTALSRLEKRADILVSTLCQYVEALGAKVRIDAILRDNLAQKFEAGVRSRLYNDQLLLPIIGAKSNPERRDLVLSIKPKYSGKIVKGEKTVELRRRFPSTVQPGTIVLIYETSPTRALTGVAEIADVIEGPTNAIWKQFSDQMGIERDDFDDYFAGTRNGFAIKLRGARRLSRILELQELRDRFSFEPPQSFLYAPPELREALSHECSKIFN
ncbi:MAG: helix-turn-helix domain-containing protein [Alphaproteobacteria bacterium]|nr:helix-turn-helix domain-containing protein [Alphaproteobacteria bacterium]MDE2493416.1 helix-turn-helix domain-containing protein [Alphaproteobacteria bacterium]